MKTGRDTKIIYPALSVLIPCLLGIVGMISKKVSVAIWAQNPLAILLLTVACYFVSKRNLKYNDKAVVIGAAVLLGLTFLGPNMNGVHRWLRLAFLSLNIASIVIPVAIIALYRLVGEKRFAISITGMVVIACLLCLQPDASELLAFSLPMAVLLLKSQLSKLAKGGVCAVLLLLTARSWILLDALPPVDYTEGVLAMLSDVSVVLSVAGLAALLCAPVGLLVFCKEKNRDVWMGIALYHWLLILSTFAGNFPVPFMGYGISPILGFFAALIWFMGEDKTAQRE